MKIDWTKPLPARPENLVINGDAEALEIASQLGIADELNIVPDTIPCSISFLHEDHPSHWAIFVRGWGHADPRENGYSAILVPKRLVKKGGAEFRSMLGHFGLNA